MEIAAYAVLALSALGLGLSVVSHVCALAGVDGPLGDLTFGLHIGIFVVWLPTIWFSRKLVGDNVPRSDAWKASLRGCPPWMRYALYGLFGYAILNFAAFFVFNVASGPAGRRSGGPMPPSVVRGFSGHWMMFYAAAFAVTYSYLRVGSQPQPRCVNGHEIGPLAKFCEQCGAPASTPHG
jgi:hypothetical protein